MCDDNEQKSRQESMTQVHSIITYSLTKSCIQEIR